MNTKEDPRRSILLSIILPAAAGSLLYAVSAGIRQNYGVLMTAIANSSGVPFATVSLIVAIGKLVFGITQPVFGAVSLRRSNRFVLICGSILGITGLTLIPFCRSFFSLILFLGIILPAGTGAISFGVIMSALTPLLKPSAAAAVSGVVSASSGLGNIFLSPILQSLIENSGLRTAVYFLAVLVLILIPVSAGITPKRAANRQESGTADKSEEPITGIIREAVRNRNYICLTLGFFTCGYHMGIVEMHYYNQVVVLGFSEKTAAYALSLFGIASILGSLLSGILCSKMRMKNVLTLIYGSRAVFVTAFLLLPKNTAFIYTAAAVFGLIGAGTVPPTSGLAEQMFGAAKLALLFGFSFMVNQTGAFLSVWLSGLCVSRTGSYTPMWISSLVLCAAASVICSKIQEDAR